MAKRTPKKSNPKPSSERSPAPASPVDLAARARVLGRMLLGLCGVAFVVALGWSALQGLVALSDAAARLPELHQPTSHIQITPPPDWLAIDPRPDWLLRAGLDGETFAPAERDLVPRIAAACSGSPWVEQVEARKTPERLDVTITYRRPVLCLPWGTATGNLHVPSHCCYVSGDGVVLPPLEADPASFRRCLVLEGVPEAPTPEIGKRFGDPAIVAACRVAELLLPHDDRLGVRVVELRETADGGWRWDLKTQQNSRIRWGLGVEPADVLALADDKLDFLLRQSEAGQLDAASGPTLVDLTRLPFSNPVPLALYRSRVTQPTDRTAALPTTRYTRTLYPGGFTTEELPVPRPRP